MENKFDIGDLYTNGKNHWGKTPPDEFKVITPKNPLLNLRSSLLRIHYYQSQVVRSKRNPSTQYQPIVEPLPQYPIGLVL